MSGQFLEFEQPIAELEAKIKELRMVGQDTDLNLSEEIKRLEKKCVHLTKEIFKELSPWQITQLARHPLRPHGSDYIAHLFTDFEELFGDRHSASGAALISGIGRFDGQPVVIIANEKGRKTQEKIERNFGMPNPEDYRKALRLFQLAEKFSLPIFTFIDTPGAFPGIHAEEKNQSEAIARNLFVLSQLRTPIICTVTGEGGSGGALAIGIGDRVLMLQYAIYSVISPEGCASILWKNAEKAPLAAEAMGLTADKIYKLGLVDEILPEPLGGAHKNMSQMMDTTRESLSRHFHYLKSQPIDRILETRYKRLLSYGN